jgi:hypothetical protein
MKASRHVAAAFSEKRAAGRMQLHRTDTPKRALSVQKHTFRMCLCRRLRPAELGSHPEQLGLPRTSDIFSRNSSRFLLHQITMSMVEPGRYR